MPEDIFQRAAETLTHQLLVLKAGYDPAGDAGRTLVALMGSPDVASEEVIDVLRLASELILPPDFVPSWLSD